MPQVPLMLIFPFKLNLIREAKSHLDPCFFMISVELQLFPACKLSLWPVQCQLVPDVGLGCPRPCSLPKAWSIVLRLLLLASARLLWMVEGALAGLL